MSYCMHCGAELEEGASFCSKCGTAKDGVNQNQPIVHKGKRNDIALAGFVLSFLFPVLGLIFSAIGYYKAPEYNGDRKDLAKIGLIISIVFVALSAISIPFIRFNFQYST